MMKTFKSVLVFAVILCVSMPACAFVKYNPATGDEEVVFISTEKEINMGRNIDEKVIEKFDLPTDPLMQERIENIGKKLSKGTDRGDLVYHFRVLDHEKKDYYNAFAAPGGYIYIFEDLVNALKEDHKIAGVLAHEMGHVEARHSVKRLQGAMGATALMLLGGCLSRDGRTKAQAYCAINQLMASYSRHDEEQADELSVKYMKIAGYDPEGAVLALKELKRLRKKGPRMKYMMFRSHPYLSQRIAHLSSLVGGHADFDSYINRADDVMGI